MEYGWQVVSNTRANEQREWDMEEAKALSVIITSCHENHQASLATQGFGQDPKVAWAHLNILSEGRHEAMSKLKHAFQSVLLMHGIESNDLELVVRILELVVMVENIDLVNRNFDRDLEGNRDKWLVKFLGASFLGTGLGLGLTEDPQTRSLGAVVAIAREELLKMEAEAGVV